MIDEKYIIKLNGKNFVTYEGLLQVGHEKGLKSIRVNLVQIPNKENDMTAVAMAHIVGSDGEVYIDYGDASPASVNSKIIPHIIRMASTRAKARGLRDFTNIGMTAIEELNPNDVELTEPATLAQLNLLKKLSKEYNVKIDYEGLDKRKSSELIEHLKKSHGDVEKGVAK